MRQATPSKTRTGLRASTTPRTDRIYDEIAGSKPTVQLPCPPGALCGAMCMAMVMTDASCVIVIALATVVVFGDGDGGSDADVDSNIDE